MSKPKIAICDFTDCEGCQVQIISLREKLLDLEKHFDIVDWRLVQAKKEKGPYFATLVEGTPITPSEIETLKYFREQSKYIFGLGSCASLAGIPGIISKENREKWYKIIYGAGYKPQGIDALPIQAFVKVDFLIHGCPVGQEQLVRFFEELMAGQTPSYRNYSVCFECKVEGNPCRLVEKKPCLGPITQAGCKAVCVSGGSACYGCFGLRTEPNIRALLTILNNITDKKEIERYFTMFLSRTEEYQKIVKPNL
ncbi:MAG: hypothetical protein HYW69_03340 [Candidatus Nealsonbacteria bacterium]|nr:hypothetical protein [Candidatus Nealsonbacteria bacterium]